MKITCPTDSQHDEFVRAVTLHVGVDRYNNILDSHDELAATVFDKVKSDGEQKFVCMVCGERGKVEP